MAKYDLAINPPLMNAAGSLGFSPDLYSEMDWSAFGAFITNPVSRAARTPARGKHFIAFPGGFLLHTGYPNPGFSQVLRRYARQWNRSPLPVIVHLLAHDPEEVAGMVRRLEAVEGVVGLEIGVANDAREEHVAALTQASSAELAVVVRLPMECSPELAQAALQAGAAAISLAPPRGTCPTSSGELVQGRCYGPAVFPLALRKVQELKQLGIPTIGGCGVYSQAQADAMLSAGVLAVQLDSFLWRGAGIRQFK